MLKSKTVIELLHCSNRNKITKVFLERWRKQWWSSYLAAVIHSFFNARYSFDNTVLTLWPMSCQVVMYRRRKGRGDSYKMLLIPISPPFCSISAPLISLSLSLSLYLSPSADISLLSVVGSVASSSELIWNTNNNVRLLPFWWLLHSPLQGSSSRSALILPPCPQQPHIPINTGVTTSRPYECITIS